MPQIRTARLSRNQRRLNAEGAEDAEKTLILELTGLLLEAGADPKVKDKSGRTAMAETESPAIRRLLVDKGASVNVMVGDATRLQHYIREGKVAQVKGWLEFKPDPLTPDRQGRTAKELARMYAANPTGTYEGDAARREISVRVEAYQNKFFAGLK